MAKELTLEQQIEALTKQNEALQKTKEAQASALEVKETLIQQLQVDLEKQKVDLANKVEEIRSKDEEAEANLAIIAGYEAKLRAAAAQAEGGAPVVEHEGQLYRVISPEFHFEGKKVTAESLVTDSSLVAKLVALGAGVLEKVEEPAE